MNNEYLKKIVGLLGALKKKSGHGDTGDQTLKNAHFEAKKNNVGLSILLKDAMHEILKTPPFFIFQIIFH